MDRKSHLATLWGNKKDFGDEAQPHRVRRANKVNKTKIEWVKNPDDSQGYTWNPITGCLNHVNGTCNGGGFPCYAYRLAHGRLKGRYLANKNIAPIGTMIVGAAMGERALKDPFHPRFWEDRLEPVGLTGGKKRPHSYGHLTGYKDHKPKGIFACDMSDLFGIGVPEEWTRKVMNTINACTSHRFYLLTKQPQNLIKFSPFPDNCWVGVTATDWMKFSDALGHLAIIEAKTKYLSLEPLLGEIKLDMLQQMLFPQVIDWVTIGAQTKPFKPPKIEWVREIIKTCDKAGIAVFLKNNLQDIWEAPLPDGYLRQELPK